jgi:hypothetical protein
MDVIRRATLNGTEPIGMWCTKYDCGLHNYDQETSGQYLFNLLKKCIISVSQMNENQKLTSK